MPLTQKGDFPDISKASKEVLENIPVSIANLAKNHYLDGFRRGGKQTDASRSGWAKRKKKDKNRQRRAILVKTGQLRNDVDIRRTTKNEIVLGTLDTVYASYHNEGAEFLPKREFLGDSKILDRKISKHIIRKMDKAFK